MIPSPGNVRFKMPVPSQLSATVRCVFYRVVITEEWRRIKALRASFGWEGGQSNVVPVFDGPWARLPSLWGPDFSLWSLPPNLASGWIGIERNVER
jgi:hypothetical protein